MKPSIFATILLLLHSFAQAQEDSGRRGGINGLFKKAAEAVNAAKGNSGSSLASAEIVQGLKEALSLGAEKSTGKLSLPDGFLKDAAVKIFMPEEVRKVESRMKMIGLGKVFDEAVLTMNRAAEDASKAAGPIFLEAIKSMTVQDALSILKGTDTAATSYLKKATSNELTNAFRPVIESSLKKFDATKYWKEVFTAYNRFAATPVTADINEYVTERALRGIFYYVAEEEKKIRTNPAARATDILKKVFSQQ